MADFLLKNEIFYHGTRAEFDSFRPLSHFGSWDAAAEVLKTSTTVKKEKLDGMADIIKPTTTTNHGHSKIIPVKLNLSNTYEVQDIAACHDLNTYKGFMAYHIWHDLKLDFIPHFFIQTFAEPFNIPHQDVINELRKDNLYTPTSEREDRYHLAFQRTIHYFESIGYDGFHYVNQYEDTGHTSYIVFRPENIYRQDKITTVNNHKIIKKTIAETFPAHKITDEYKKILHLEDMHHHQIFGQKLYRQKIQSNPSHTDKTKAHYIKIFYMNILPKIKQISKQPEFGYHGLIHTEQTVLFGLDIAITCAHDPLPVILACALHDILRINSNTNNLHGPRAVPYVRKFLMENFPELHRNTVEEIVCAVKKHSSNEKADNLTAACTWDADRIRMAWDHIYRPEYFTTEYGKHLADLPPGARAEYLEKQNALIIRDNIKTATQIEYERKKNQIAIEREFDIKFR